MRGELFDNLGSGSESEGLHLHGDCAAWREPAELVDVRKLERVWVVTRSVACRTRAGNEGSWQSIREDARLRRNRALESALGSRG